MISKEVAEENNLHVDGSKTKINFVLAGKNNRKY